MPDKIAIVGTGLVGSAWAIVFARAGHRVALYDGTDGQCEACLLYTSPSPRDGLLSRMPSSA